MNLTNSALMRSALVLGFGFSSTSLSSAVVAQTGDLGSLGIVDGEILNTQLQAPFGITISGLDSGGSPTAIAGYDTEGAIGADDDLERLAGTNGGNPGEWAAGNTDLGTVLGIIPIIQDGATQGQTTPGVFDTPNDDAAGGTIIFDLEPSRGYRQFKVVIVDVDDPLVNGAGAYFARLTGENGGVSENIDLQALAVVGDPRLRGVPTTVEATHYVERSLNDFGSLDISDWVAGETIITKVEYIITAESGGTGAFAFDTVPEPSSALLAFLGLGFVLRRKR